MKFKIIISKTETEVVEGDKLLISDEHILIIKSNQIIGVLPSTLIVIPTK